MTKTLTTTMFWAIIATAYGLALISSVTLGASEGRASVVGYPPKDPTTISGISSTGDCENLTHETVRATGVLEKLEGTAFQYGTHAITDEASRTHYALQSTYDGPLDVVLDLDRYIGQRVTVTGLVVPGYPIDFGPPLLEVTEVRPAEEVVVDLPPLPPSPIINDPKDNSYDTDGSVTFSGSAEAGCKISLFEEGKPEPVGSASADGSGAWSITLSDVTEGTHTYTAKVTNSSGLTSVASEPVRVSVDTQAPKVTSTVPPSNATGIGPGVNVSATFSEALMDSSINGTTFKLMKAGTTTTIGAVVSYDSTTKKATLNPTNNLRLGTKYKAVVSTGAKDLAGNRLDQDQDPSNGNQPKQWVFTVRR